MRYFNWQNVRLVLIVGAIGFLFAFTSKRHESRFLKGSEVVFPDDESPLVTPESVNKLLIENNRSATAIREDKVDLSRLEKALNMHEMIEKSEVFVTIDGVLKAVVKQKTPIARVLNENGSFYIDYEGNEMPLSDNYSVRVPLVAGVDGKAAEQEIAETFRAIHDDDFLKENIIGVTVSPTGSMAMKSRNFGYTIDFGKPVNIERKFSNYKAFFQKASADSTIAKYKVINLKFTQQVVCAK
jgi:cell division protein FtsQ